MTTYSSLHYAEVARRLAGGTADEIAEIQGYESLPAKSAKEYAEEAKTYATPIGFIGEIVATFCSDTYTPEGCLPCDGTEYTKASFPSLWSNYLTGDAPNLLTCTYEEYTTSVTTYGSCAKFAVDSTNEKFKVPLIQDGAFIQQGSTSPGECFNAGLPNITGSVATGHWCDATGDNPQGALYNDRIDHNASEGGSATNGDYTCFDASLSNPIYGNSETVQPKSVALRHFVVVAFGTQNESQMDWSEWATSLAGKLNTDFSNKPDNIHYVVDSWKSEDGSSWYRKYSDGWIEQGGIADVPTSDDWVVKEITLPAAFTTTNYSISVSGISHAGSANYGIGTLREKSATSFSHYFYNSIGIKPSWYVCGY